MFMISTGIYILPPLSVLTRTNLYLGFPALKSGRAVLMLSMLYFWIQGEILCSAAKLSIFLISAGEPT